MRLTFFCELGQDDLLALFADDAVIDQLKALDASVSLGILDLSEGRAQVVKELNAIGIPVIVWLLLPTSQGYWFNVNNAPQAAARYHMFRAWTARHGLKWAGIGLDIEPDRREIDRVMKRPYLLPPYLLKNAFDGGRVKRAQTIYERLIRQMHADGYRVDIYHIPLVVDERRVGSAVLRRLAGLVDLPADREVLMLYTSFMGKQGAGILWSYGAEAQSIGVGSTGGGVDIADLTERTLSWDQLTRDLQLAARLTDDVHIFSLEGAVKQGYLKRLTEYDWSQQIPTPIQQAQSAEQMRQVFRTAFWVGAHLRQIAAASVALVFLFQVTALLRRWRGAT